MRDLLSNLGTNLHILVVSMLIVGLGLGMISSTSTNPRSGKNKHNDQSAITLSTTPSAPPKQSQPPAQPTKRPQPQPTSTDSSHPGAIAAEPSSPGSSEHSSGLAPGTDTAAAPPADPSQPLQPCAMCDDTADCPGSCLQQSGLPWRRPQPPASLCCGGRKVSIAYQPDFVICPTACGNGTT